jgi:hypothetical protein
MGAHRDFQGGGHHPLRHGIDAEVSALVTHGGLHGKA